MLISYEDFLDSGVPTSDDLRTEEIEYAIRTVETTYIKPLITSDYYVALSTGSLSDDDYYVLNGDGNVMGMKDAICHAVFAYMLWDRMRLTRYTTVIKDDEHSVNPDVNDIYDICQTHHEIAITNIIDTLLAYGHEPATDILPNPPYCELAFPVYKKKKKW